MHPLLRSPTGAVSCNGPGLATRSRRSRRKTAAKTSIPYLTIIDNNACNLSMILDTREKTFFTGHPLYRLITTAGASGAVWHATVFPVPGVVRRRGPGGHRSTPSPARIGPGEVALRAGSSLLPAPRPSLPPSHLSKIQELSLYYGIHRKIEKWLFGAAEFLRNSIAPARIGLFSRKNSSNGPQPEFRRKRGKALSRRRVETVVVVRFGEALVSLYPSRSVRSMMLTSHLDVSRPARRLVAADSSCH